jgi:hypothetical protein
MSETALAPASAPPAARRRWLPPTPYHAEGGLSVSDLIVIIGGIALLIAGWALQRAHDARLQTAEVAGLHVAYPEGWIPLPVMPPALAQWTDNQGLGATLTVYAEPIASETSGVQSRSPNPVEVNPAYTPLRSEPATIGNVEVIQADYAYARQVLASSTPPEIVVGREVSWTANGQRYALVLEAPQQDWSRFAPLFDSLATAVVAAGVAG